MNEIKIEQILRVFCKFLYLGIFRKYIIKIHLIFQRRYGRQKAIKNVIIEMFKHC